MTTDTKKRVVIAWIDRADMAGAVCEARLTNDEAAEVQRRLDSRDHHGITGIYVGALVESSLADVLEILEGIS